MRPFVFIVATRRSERKGFRALPNNAVGSPRASSPLKIAPYSQ